MKRSFTYTLSRKVSTAPYENVDVFAAEGIESEDITESAFEREKEALIKRVTNLVNRIAQELRRANED